MTPNRRERLVEKALGWARVRTRAGSYVKAFGWSRSVIADGEQSPTAAAVLEALREFSDAGRVTMIVGSAERQAQPVGTISLQDFRAALSQRNQFDQSLGGARIRTMNGEISILIDWANNPDAPMTTFLATIQEDWFDEQVHVELLTRCLAHIAASTHQEYQLVSHISDEAGKLRPGPRYETRPGAGVPYVPWLLILGPAYVTAISREVLNRLGPETLTWAGGLAMLSTANNPLCYGARETVERELKVRETLGADVFLDSRGVNLKGPQYPSGYVEGPPQTGEVWNAYARDGQIDVVRSKRT